jgi:hypothetical protein
VELNLHSPNTYSWRGAQLKHTDTFTFTFTTELKFDYVGDIIRISTGVLILPSVCTVSIMYEGVSKSFRTESITKYKLTFVITR